MTAKLIDTISVSNLDDLKNAIDKIGETGETLQMPVRGSHWFMELSANGHPITIKIWEPEDKTEDAYLTITLNS